MDRIGNNAKNSIKEIDERNKQFQDYVLRNLNINTDLEPSNKKSVAKTSS